MNDIEKIIVSSEGEGKRLDVVICEQFPDITRSFVHKLISKGRVFLNKKEVSKHHKVKVNDEILIDFPKPESFNIVAQNIELNIVYEDEFLMVINKPKGMVVHPAPGHYDNTLVNAIMWHCKDNLSDIGGVLRPGIVHRIDKDTSGLLLIAKTNEAYYSLVDQIKQHSIDRVYEAVVHGNFKQNQGVLNFPIGRSKIDRKKMAIRFDCGKEAITNFEVIQQFKGFTHLRLKLETGRTHQIRVHLSYIGHPVAGDEVYGPKRNGVKLGGQCLHAKVLGFFHFKLRRRLIFDSELDESFKHFLDKLSINLNKHEN